MSRGMRVMLDAISIAKTCRAQRMTKSSMRIIDTGTLLQFARFGNSLEHHQSNSRVRSFGTTVRRDKKKVKHNENDDGNAAARVAYGVPQSDGDANSFDFSNLQMSIEEAKERLRSGLRQVSSSRGIQQDTVEAVRVKVKGVAETARLSDIAQVVPRGGRTISIFVGQKEMVKSITSAVLSELEVNPIPTGDDPLELRLTIPPPTQESRRKAQQQVVIAGEKAIQAVRQARSNQQKRHRTMELSKNFRPDDLRKAGKRMEELVERGNAEVKKMTETAKKALEG